MYMEAFEEYAGQAAYALESAETPYNIATQHDDTQIQLEALERSEQAMAEVKAHSEAAKGLGEKASGMESTADENQADAIAAKNSVASIDFTDFLEEIDELIEEAKNSDGSPLDDWLETVVPNFSSRKWCSSRSVKKATNDDLNAAGFAHMCPQDNKMLQITLKGKRGVGAWYDKVVSTTHDHITPTCSQRNITKSYGWERCIWKIPQSEGQKFAIGFNDEIDPSDMSLGGFIKHAAF